VSVTIGILISYWIDYGTNYIGGTRCAPDIPYSGGTSSKPIFDPYHDVPAGGCTGQSEVSWRLPLALQIVPAVILGVGMLFFPDSPRWLLMKERDDDSLHALSRLRRQDRDSPVLLNEYLEIKASIMLENSFARDNFPNLSGFKLHVAQVCSRFPFNSILSNTFQYMSFLTNWSRFRRLAIGCIVMFFQQFMGCNGMSFPNYTFKHSF
jgi:hypothetical protein